MNILEKILDRSERPIGFGKSFDEIDGFFTSSYIFASNFTKNKNVLDIGCGSGYGANFLSTNGAHSVVGIDNSRKVVAQCQRYYRDTSNLVFREVDCTSLDFDDESFDVVTAFELIEHISDYEVFLKEASRVLKQGGVCILATPNKKVWSPGLRTPIIVWHVKEFYPEELRIILSRHFSEVKILAKDNKFRIAKEALEMDTRLKVTRMLASVNFIRQVSRYLPLWVRQLITGNSKKKIKASDFTITDGDNDKAYSLIAVCKK